MLMAEPEFDMASSTVNTSSAPTGKKASSKRKRSIDSDAGPKTEPKKRSVSCDVCRMRKVKCVKPPGVERCEGCVLLDQPCIYTFERRRPGPSNGYARKTPPFISPAAGPSGAKVRPSSQNGGQPFYDANKPKPPAQMSNARATSPPLAMAAAATSHFYPPVTDRDYGFRPPSPINESPFDHFNTSLPSFLQEPPGQHEISWAGPDPALFIADSASESSPTNLLWDLQNSLTTFQQPASTTMGHHNQTGGWHGHDRYGSLSQQPPSRGNSLDASAAGSSLGAGIGTGFQTISSALPGSSTVKVTSVEEILPWATVLAILGSYHQHLYALMPIVHWPTFSQQLIARADEKDPVLRAFILSLVSYAIVQLPRSSLAFLPVKELRRLHQRCHAASRLLQDSSFRLIVLNQIATLYCDHIYLSTLGQQNKANATLAVAIRMAQTLGLHDERLGENVSDVVLKETRRRVFWLLYGSDRTLTVLTSSPLHFNDADLYLPYPLSIDDNLLTTAGAFPQPPNQIPILAGFHQVSKLFRLLSAILTAHRTLADSSSAFFPNFSGLSLISHRPNPRSFADELERILSGVPGPLRLSDSTVSGNPSLSTSPYITTPGSNTTHRPGAHKLNAAPSSASNIANDNVFATCRANLLVTQALVRFALHQYARFIGETEGDEGSDWAARDVLNLLESMSSEALAANGESLRHKVLFIASSLLDKYPSTTEGHGFVAEFLAVYTKMSDEQTAALESCMPSRVGTPQAES